MFSDCVQIGDQLGSWLVANPKHLAILRKGGVFWNSWMTERIEAHNDAKRTNDPSWADLTGIDLSDTDLTGYNFIFVNFSNTNLCHANLKQAYLPGANFAEASLIGATFTNAVCGNTVFACNDLSKTIGMESIEHIAPSTIGIDTLIKSNGNIPESFLRGCGVPDVLIEYAALLVGKPIRFYSAFISYSSKDDALARRLHNDLQAKGVRCWFAPEDLKIGDRFRPRINEAIRLHDKLLLLLSANSILSGWVETEVETALERERRDKYSVLFPIRLDETVLESPVDWASEIRGTRHIGDFSNWKDHDSYQKAFDRLLRDLKAEKGPPKKL